jgi:hypothetical protein
MEEWKQTIYFNYEASSLGNIRNKSNGHILKPQIHKRPGGKRGYYIVYMNKKKVKVHQIIAHTFFGDPDPSILFPTVDHIDGNRLNNEINNLRWLSHQENSLKQ